jgi:hypothetical protein
MLDLVFRTTGIGDKKEHLPLRRLYEAIRHAMIDEKHDAVQWEDIRLYGHNLENEDTPFHEQLTFDCEVSADELLRRVPKGTKNHHVAAACCRPRHVSRLFNALRCRNYSSS